MKGFIVVSAARNFLTHRVDESRALEPVFVGWTNERKNALRYASKKQAKRACEIFPLAMSTVEPAKLLSMKEIDVLDELAAWEGATGPMLTASEDRICQRLVDRGFARKAHDADGEEAFDITPLGKIVLNEVTS